MKNIFFILIFLFTFVPYCHAVQADDSVHDYIKSKYNTESAEKSLLPKLPKTSPKAPTPGDIFDNRQTIPESNIPDSVSVPTKPVQSAIVTKVPQKVNVKSSKIRRGKKVHTRITHAVSDRTREGTRVSFITAAPFTNGLITVPRGAVITGTVVNSHPPQILGNGGLLSVKAEYISYNGKTSYFNANIVSQRHKFVLFNNIKGNNGYFKGIAKVTAPGRTFMRKAARVSKKLWNGPGAILTPITYGSGIIFLVLDCAVSPFVAVFSKGDRVYIPQNSDITVKLQTDSYIEY